MPLLYPLSTGRRELFPERDPTEHCPARHLLVLKVIYRQDASALRITTDEMELSDRERALIKTLPKGTGLWRLGNSSFEVKNDLTRAEVPLFDTDARMDMIA
nr:hypothetical protein mcr_00005 [Micrococcus sp.]